MKRLLRDSSTMPFLEFAHDRLLEQVIAKI